jgi:hypothetical protein
MGAGSSGWAMLREGTTANTKGRLYVKTVGAGEAGQETSLTVTTATGTPIKRQIQTVAFRGVDPAAMVLANAKYLAETASTTTHTFPSVTVQTAGSWYVQHYCDRVSIDPPYVTPPGFRVERVAPVPVGGTGQVTCGTWTRGSLTVGTAGAADYTGTAATADCGMWTLLLEPTTTAAAGWTEVRTFTR